MRQDLFALAAANASRIAASFQAKFHPLAPEGRESMEAFCRLVHETGGVSANMKPYKLLRYLAADRFLTVREIAAEDAASAGCTPEEQLRRQQGDYYERRVLFETSFVDGERFLYGALNIGGSPGIPSYGVFCAFLHRETMAGLRTAYLPDDSLKRYVPKAEVLVFDFATLCNEVAPHEQHHSLVATKHCEELVRSPETSWPASICRPGEYVEVIFVGEVPLTHIHELRASPEAMDRLFHLTYDVRVRDLPKKEADEIKAEIEAFEQCIKELRRKGLWNEQWGEK